MTEENRIMKENEEVKGKVIRSGAVANRLLDMGNRIIRVKRDRTDPDGKKSCYVFAWDDKLEKDLESVMSEPRTRRDNIEGRVQKEVEARVKAEMEKYLEKFKECGGNMNA